MGYLDQYRDRGPTVGEVHRAVKQLLSGYITVAYDGAEREVNYDRGTTVERILMYSLIEHGLPTPAYRDFRLLDRTGTQLRGAEIAEFIGVTPGDALTLEYAPAERT